MKESKAFKYAVIGVITFWLILFVLFPNVMLFISSFLTRDEVDFVSFKFTLANYKRILDPVYYKVLIKSFRLAFITTVICVSIAFPFAYIMSKFGKRTKNILLMLIIVPFWTSALIRTYAIKIILTTNGILNSLLMKTGIIEAPVKFLHTPGAVITGLVYTLLPFMILPIFAVMDKLDKRYFEAASDLGATKLDIILRIIIPLTFPGIIAGSLLVFLPALGLFYIPDMLGGSKEMLFGNLVKIQFLESRNWPFGSAVSVALTLLMAVLLLANLKTIKNLNKKGLL